MSLISRFLSSVALATAVMAGIALVSNSASASPLNLVANGSFDAGVSLPFPNTVGCGANPSCSYNNGPITDWNISGGQAGLQNLGPNILLPLSNPAEAYTNGSVIWQTINNLVVGQTYELQVAVGQRFDGYNGIPVIDLYEGAGLGGLLFVNRTLTPPSAGSWFVSTGSGVAPSTTVTIALTNTGLQGNFDNVSLTATTPLPSTWTMLIAGFVGLGFLAYRGTKKNAAALATA